MRISANSVDLVAGYFCDIYLCCAQAKHVIGAYPSYNNINLL